MPRVSSVIAYTEDPLLAVWLQETVEEMLPEVAFVLHNPVAEDGTVAQQITDHVVLAFIDVRRHQHPAIVTVSQMREQFNAPVIVFARPADAAIVVRAFDAGAAAYLDVHSRDATLRETMERVLASARGGAASADGLVGFGLSDRERAILTGMARGLTNAEIAAELFVSADTIKTQVKKLFTRLGVHTRAGAVAEGIRRQLVA
ncbi:MAG: hypothetical protein RL745_698 [Actinomycetota bacterium]